MRPDLWFAVFGLVLFCAGAVTGWWGRGARDARRRYDAQIDGYQRVIAERQAGRHERTQPRAQASGEGPQRGATRAPDANPYPSPEPTHLRREISRRPTQVRRLVTTADDIGPVIVPRGATTVPMRPQPPRTSGAGTQTLPRLTTTGELRKLAEDTGMYLARMHAEEAEWRAAHGFPCETDRQEAGLNP